MNPGTLILVGCVVATGAFVYQGTMAGATVSPVSPTPEIARGTATSVPTRTPTPVFHDNSAPTAAAYPTVVLTLDQVRDLTRPPQPAASGGGNFNTGGVSNPAPAPTATPTPTPVLPPSETGTATVPASPSPPVDRPPSTPTPQPDWPTPTPTPGVNWWNLPTPPPLPPPPDNWAGPRPPSEG